MTGTNIGEEVVRPGDIFLCLFPEVLCKSVALHTNLYATQNNLDKQFEPTNSD